MFIYQILAELDNDLSGGLDFDQFFKLATTKLNENDSKQDVKKVYKSFDRNGVVIF